MSRVATTKTCAKPRTYALTKARSSPYFLVKLRNGFAPAALMAIRGLPCGSSPRPGQGSITSLPKPPSRPRRACRSTARSARPDEVQRRRAAVSTIVLRAQTRKLPAPGDGRAGTPALPRATERVVVPRRRRPPSLGGCPVDGVTARIAAPHAARSTSNCFIFGS